MAERSSVLKSNWFTVKDVAAFREFIASVPGDFTVETRDDAPILGTAVRFHGYDEQPGILKDPETDEELADFEQALAEHLTDESMAIIAEICHTGLEHLEGWIVAINNKGIVTSNSLVDDFLDKLDKHHNVTLHQTMEQ